VTDNSIRYIAEEYITVSTDGPSLPLLSLAGRYFLRWDWNTGAFVSNLKRQYPDD